MAADYTSPPQFNGEHSPFPETSSPMPRRHLRLVGHLAAATAQEYSEPIGPERPVDPIFGPYTTPAEDAAELRLALELEEKRAQARIDKISINAAALRAEATKAPRKVVSRLARRVLEGFPDRRVQADGHAWVDFVDNDGGDLSGPVIEVSAVRYTDGHRELRITRNGPHGQLEVAALPGQEFSVVERDPLGRERPVDSSEEQKAKVAGIVDSVSAVLQTASARDNQAARALADRHISSFPGVPWDTDERAHLTPGIAGTSRLLPESAPPVRKFWL